MMHVHDRSLPRIGEGATIDPVAKAQLSRGRAPTSIRHRLADISVSANGMEQVTRRGFTAAAPIQFKRRKKKFVGTRMSLGAFHSHSDNQKELRKLSPRIQALAQNANNILGAGVLTRRDLTKRGKNFSGSVDRGKGIQDAVSVNLLRAVRSDDAAKVSSQSLTAPNHGSLSVAMERADDEHLTSTFQKPPLTAEEEGRLANENPAMRKMLRKAMIANTAPQPTPEAIEELSKRTQGSVLAITTPRRLRGGSTKSRHRQLDHFANAPPESRSEEHQLLGSIAPQALHSLLVPEALRSHSHLLDNPHNVPLRFVGNKTTHAHFKPGHRSGSLPVQIEAPDYESELTKILKKNPRLVTHLARKP